MSNILVTGAGGMLGEKIVDFFSKNPLYNIYATYRSFKPSINCDVNWCEIDLSNTSRLEGLLSAVRPDIIIHCAAIVNLDQCEIDDFDAIYLHSSIIKEFKKYSPNSIFVYISTDSIFDGEKGGYRENELASPINKYALSKYYGEKNVINNFKDFIIIRTNIYGFHTNCSKSSLVEWAVSKIRNNEIISGFDDVIFNPVYTLQLAQVIGELLKLNFVGIINVGSDEALSKFAFLKILANKFSFNEEYILKSSSKKCNFIAKRPLNTSLNNDLLKSIVNIDLSCESGLKMLFNDIIKNKNV